MGLEVTLLQWHVDRSACDSTRNPSSKTSSNVSSTGASLRTYTAEGDAHDDFPSIAHRDIPNFTHVIYGFNQQRVTGPPSILQPNCPFNVDRKHQGQKGRTEGSKDRAPLPPMSSLEPGS